MTDTALTLPTDPGSLAPLTPTDLSLVELLSWEVMLPADAADAATKPWVVRQVASTGMTLHLLGDAPLRSLFRGAKVVEEFGSTPPPGYDLVFAFIERPMALFCASAPSPVRDQDFEKLYTELRRRPDGRYQSPLYRNLQAVLRALLLLRPTSESEIEAVLRRLARSARTFSEGATSTHYFANALAPLIAG